MSAQKPSKVINLVAKLAELGPPEPTPYPYETIWSYGLTAEPNHFFVIIHAETEHWDDYKYSTGIYGEMLEWRGVRWERNPEKYNSMMRLHDNERPERVIWADIGCITIVPENEVLNASTDPLGWLIDNYDRISSC
jgi:hypothetical protein